MNAVTPILTPVVLQNESLLRALAGEGPFVSLSALAKHLGRDASNIRRSLKSLEDEGLVERPEGRADALPDIADPGRSAVAALDRANGVGVELTAPWSIFRPHPLNPRKTFEIDALDELGEDIAARGQDQNLVCRPPGPDGILYIRSGERRWRAIGRMIEAGVMDPDFALRYIVRDEDDAEHLIGALGENLQRAALNPIEEAQALAYMRDELGMSTAAIAARIAKGQRFVQLRLQLLTAPEIIQVSVREGKMGVMEALSKIQEKKVPPAPPAWTPNPKLALVMVETVSFIGPDADRRLLPRELPNGEVGPLHQSLISEAGMGMIWHSAGAKNTRMVTICVHAKTLAILDRIGLNPHSDATALFRARQQAGLCAAHIHSLEATGLYASTFLNPPPAARDEPPRRAADPSEGAASPAAPSRSFADQLAEATQDDEDETAEMFPEAGELMVPSAEAQPDQPPARNAYAYAHALRLMEDAAPQVAEYLDMVEHDGDFDWAKADCPALADKVAYYFHGETVLGVIGAAVALLARGGADMFSERALRGALDGLRRKTLTNLAFVPEPGRAVKLAFDLHPDGEIVDAADGGRMATTEEGVDLQDAAAMAGGPELLRALRGLLAVAPKFAEDDEDEEAVAAYQYAEQVHALVTRLGDQ